MAIMGYTFARVSAVVGLARGDYRLEGKRARLRLLEKGIRNSWYGCITKQKPIRERPSFMTGAKIWQS